MFYTYLHFLCDFWDQELSVNFGNLQVGRMSLGNTKNIKSWISEDSELGGSTVYENETSCLISKVYKIFTLNRKEVELANI